MKLSKLCRSAGIECPADKENLEITGVTSDSRRAKPGCLFVCLPGTHTDGAVYADAAKAAGARAVLYNKAVPNGLFCADTLSAMPKLCRKYYGEGIDRLKLVAVTGTNGKTTVVALLKAIFTAAGHNCGSVGTLGCLSSAGEIDVRPYDENANLTTPDPEDLYPALSQMEKNGDEYVFLEASSHALARRKLHALTFEAGIFTNLTRDHLDFHESFDNYLAAKAELPKLSRQFILNGDDKNARLILPSGGVTCSEKRDADFTADRVELYGNDGCAYRLNCERYSFTVQSRLPGGFTVMNTLQAAACALALGVKPLAVYEGIAATLRIDGRMEKVGLSSDADITVYIDYAHTPDALEGLLASARKISGKGRVVLLFGCGGDRDRGKRREMGIIATRYADFTVITSDNSRTENPETIISDILCGIDKEKRYTVINNRKAAIEYVIKESRPGDLILLAGKGHEKYEIDKDGRHPFDEAAIVRKAWIDR